jgi:hypothetical protein
MATDGPFPEITFMPRYTVENTRTEERTEHRTWGAAMRAAGKHDASEVVIKEKDRDGEREYNQEGKMLQANGHYE